MATDANRYALASQAYLVHLSLRPKQDQARRASVKSDLKALATSHKTAAEELLPKCQAEKREMEEEGGVKAKELKAKQEQQLADFRKKQEVEREAQEKAWGFKMEMEEKKIATREETLKTEFREKQGKLEEEWVLKRVC
jgi:hypothetical protein